MKTSLYLLLLAYLLLLSSCDKVNEEDATRRLVNSTGYSLDISVYGDDVEFNYKINPFDSIDIEGKCYCCVPDYCSLGWSHDLAYADIIFNDEKNLKYIDVPANCSGKAINGDPTGSCNGYVRSEENGLFVYTYTITEEDYEMADSIQ